MQSVYSYLRHPHLFVDLDYVLWYNSSLMRPVLNFISEVRLELSKVTWPSRAEVVKLTLIVFLVSVILGSYVGGLDFLFTKILTAVIK